MMKTLGIFMGLMLAISFVSAQQLPTFSTWFLTDQYSNPANILRGNVKRISNDFSLSAMGIDDAPRSYYLSYANPIAKKNKSKSASYSLSELKLTQFNSVFGGYFMYDSYGFINQISGMITYAQRFKINNDWDISFGLSTGIYSLQYDYSKLKVKDLNDPTYQQYFQQDEKLLFWDANFGALLRYKNYRLDASIKQLLKDKAQLSNSDIKTTIIETYELQGMALFNLSKQLNLIPSVIYSKTPSLPYLLQLKADFIIQDFWLAGLNYSHDRHIGLNAGGIYQSVMLIYTFNFNTSKLSVLGNTRHEIGFQYLIQGKTQQQFTDFF